MSAGSGEAGVLQDHEFVPMDDLARVSDDRLSPAESMPAIFASSSDEKPTSPRANAWPGSSTISTVSPGTNVPFDAASRPAASSDRLRSRERDCGPPSSTTTSPSRRRRVADPRLARRQLRRTRRGTACRRASPRGPRVSAPRRNRAMTTGTPDAVAMRAASSFVRMPPDPSAGRRPSRERCDLGVMSLDLVDRRGPSPLPSCRPSTSDSMHEHVGPHEVRDERGEEIVLTEPDLVGRRRCRSRSRPAPRRARAADGTCSARSRTADDARSRDRVNRT